MYRNIYCVEVVEVSFLSKDRSTTGAFKIWDKDFIVISLMFSMAKFF